MGITAVDFKPLVVLVLCLQQSFEGLRVQL